MKISVDLIGNSETNFNWHPNCIWHSNLASESKSDQIWMRMLEGRSLINFKVI